MKTVVKRVPAVPSIDMGANAARDFKLLRGNNTDRVTPRIQNCRRAKRAGTPLPRDMAKLERKSPITSE